MHHVTCINYQSTTASAHGSTTASAFTRATAYYKASMATQLIQSYANGSVASTLSHPPHPSMLCSAALCFANTSMPLCRLYASQCLAILRSHFSHSIIIVRIIIVPTEPRGSWPAAVFHLVSLVFCLFLSVTLCLSVSPPLKQHNR